MLDCNNKKTLEQGGTISSHKKKKINLTYQLFFFSTLVDIRLLLNNFSLSLSFLS